LLNLDAAEPAYAVLDEFAERETRSVKLSGAVEEDCSVKPSGAVKEIRSVKPTVGVEVACKIDEVLPVTVVSESEPNCAAIGNIELPEVFSVSWVLVTVSAFATLEESAKVV
jgi:hypothetical protein